MNPMMTNESTRSPPIYHRSNNKNPSSAIRSPIPTSKSSPRMYYDNNQRPPPSSAAAAEYEGTEPLRRTSILYDSEKMVKREAYNGPQLPPVNHTRHNSTSSNHSRKRSSPIESSAADTLMSMSQQKFTTSKKRLLEMADDEEPEQRTSEDQEAAELNKRPRLENLHYHSSNSTVTSTSSPPTIKAAEAADKEAKRANNAPQAGIFVSS